MATFPALEPHRRSWDFGQYAMTEEPAWASTSVRYRHGRNRTENIGQGLSLSYIFLSDAEAQLIRDHYVAQQGGTLAFNLPAIVWPGPSPADVRWVYASPPEEDQRSGGLYDVTISLVTVQ
jgi:hypothetical protein